MAAHQERTRQAARQQQAGRQQAGRATWPQAHGAHSAGQPEPPQLPQLVLPVVRWASKALRGKPLVMFPHMFEYRVSGWCLINGFLTRRAPAGCLSAACNLSSPPALLPFPLQVLGKGTIVRLQLPLMLAWALTIQ